LKADFGLDPEPDLFKTNAYLNTAEKIKLFILFVEVKTSVPNPSDFFYGSGSSHLHPALSIRILTISH
jgi:hypothetical protein